ncbi:MAG: hypothetical protein M3Z54_03225 [Gemmatimonadota bacterium]|nr:hypothetical protein [Gemmatimonadota bacterium]
MDTDQEWHLADSYIGLTVSSGVQGVPLLHHYGLGYDWLSWKSNRREWRETIAGQGVHLLEYEERGIDVGGSFVVVADWRFRPNVYAIMTSAGEDSMSQRVFLSVVRSIRQR